MSSKSPKGKHQTMREFLTRDDIPFKHQNYNVNTWGKKDKYYTEPLSESKKKEYNKKAKITEKNLIQKLNSSNFTMGAGRKRKSSRRKTRKYRANRK
jgi:hypothetical protein